MFEKFQKNTPLAQHTNFEIGGYADYFWVIKARQDLLKAIAFSQKKNLPYYILGAGTNVLVSDQGFRGLILKMENQKIKVQGERIRCEAGALLKEVIRVALDHDLEGLENLWGIPGTIGGAIYGNAGAFGTFIGQRISKVRVLDPKRGKICLLSPRECQFAYRQSIFQKNKLIILEATLKLKPVQNLSRLKKRIAEIKKIRKRHPYQRCAGSVFKNIQVEDAKKISPKIPPVCFQNQEIKVACLIEQLGLKGKRVGEAEVSLEHANFIVNRGAARAQEVLALITLIRQAVKKEFKLNLETEIQFVGFPEK